MTGHPNPSTALARVVIDELVRNGVSMLVLSPGSRSGALAIAAADNRLLSTVVLIDERSAAFFALGRAKATGSPVAVVATSGTAVANWMPAVVEADLACVPMVMISADRPEELHGVGANQTIDQVNLFGNKVRSFVGIPAPDNSDRAREWREAVSAAVAGSLGGSTTPARPGPVQLNIAFREPTVPVSDDGRSQGEPYTHPTDGGEVSDIALSDPDPTIGDLLDYTPRGLVVAGDGDYDRDRLLAVTEALGWPVLATALSGLRGRGTLGSYGHRLRVMINDYQIPDLMVAVGSTGPGTTLDGLMGLAKSRVSVDRWGRVIDPGLLGPRHIAGDPIPLLERLVEGAEPDGEWLRQWTNPDRLVREALDRYLDNTKTSSGARVAWMLNRVDWGALVVASSLPIREIDAHLTRSGTVIANRGASGIDGFISTALGVASAVPRSLALSGDLSLLYDSNAWLNDGDVPLTVVVVNNDGGGLFDLLPQARHAPDFERLFITPHGRKVSDLATLHRLDYSRVTDTDKLPELVDRSLTGQQRHLIEVPVRREDDLATTKALIAAAESVLGEG